MRVIFFSFEIDSLESASNTASNMSTAPNQSQYTGQIQDGQMHGRGKLVYPNQEVYEVSADTVVVPSR